MALKSVRRAGNLDIDVVEAARQRLINTFSNGLPVYVSISGGKDSVVLAHLVWQLIREGKVDPKQVIVVYIDEEAVFDSLLEVVETWRRRFLLEGIADFRWYALEFRHFSNYNHLEDNDESFFCWDREKRDVWIREKPSHAITYHPEFRDREDTYQEFMNRINRDGIQVAGLRTEESHRRNIAMSARLTNNRQMMKPIFDWSTNDVWRYIRDHDLEFPSAYIDLYRCGMTKRELRLSMFFASTVSKRMMMINQFIPGFMEKVTRREPNAYLAALYWDTEMFTKASVGDSRRKPEKEGATGVEEGPANVDPLDYWRKQAIALIRSYDGDTTLGRGVRFKTAQRIVLEVGDGLEVKDWRELYSRLKAGDADGRFLQAIYLSAMIKRTSESGATGTWK